MFPFGIIAENIYEIHEGLAQYTEFRLNYSTLSEKTEALRTYTNIMKILPSVSWNYAYHTGSAYALLLNEFDPNWKNGVDIFSDLAQMLKYAAGITELPAFSDVNLNLYGYAEILAHDNAEMGSDIQIKRDTLAKIMTQPTVQIPMFFGRVSGASQILEIHGLTEFHGEGAVFEGEFGQLTINEGFLLAFNAIGRIIFTQENLQINSANITGNGWQLTLNEGFSLHREWPWEGSDFVVIRGESPPITEPSEPVQREIPIYYGATAPDFRSLLDAERGIIISLGDSRSDIEEFLGDGLTVRFLNDEIVYISATNTSQKEQFAIYNYFIGRTSMQIAGFDFFSDFYFGIDMYRSDFASETENILVFNAFFDENGNQVYTGYADGEIPENAAVGTFVEFTGTAEFWSILLTVEKIL
jgi:hypothetical protein